MTFDNGVEAERIALNGWIECDMPMNTRLGKDSTRTKEDVMNELKQTIEDYERFQQCKSRGSSVSLGFGRV